MAGRSDSSFGVSTEKANWPCCKVRAGDEFEQLSRAVAIMTPAERSSAETLTDEQISRLAEDAMADEAILAIFLNGYALIKK